MKNNATVKSSSKGRVSKNDWLVAALETLQTAGIEAVRVERLAAKLNVAKSGFYYHFSDRNDLHQALLDYWLSLDGTPFIRERLQADATPAQRLSIISEVVDQNDLSRYDASIRQWAKHDPKVRRVWRREMNKRLAHVRGLFAELGFSEDELEARARLFVAYTTSERDLFPELTAKDRRKLRHARIKTLIAR